MRYLMLLMGLIAAFIVLMAPGCKGMAPQNFDQAMVAVDKMRQIAEEQGVSWYATIHSTGSPEVYEKGSMGLDTGIEVTFHMQGNAQHDGVNDKTITAKADSDIIDSPIAPVMTLGSTAVPMVGGG